jgi:hypothetical protein
MEPRLWDDIARSRDLAFSLRIYLFDTCSKTSVIADLIFMLAVFILSTLFGGPKYTAKPTAAAATNKANLVVIESWALSISRCQRLTPGETSLFSEA